MAFRRPFANNGGRFNNRTAGNARQSNFNNQDGDENEARELTGILWGNGYREKQRAGAPVIQGFATINGQKFRVTGFFNPGPDFREDPAAQEEKEAYAHEINGLLLQAQKDFGAAFNLTFQDEDEWRAEREAAQSGRGGNSRRPSGPPTQARSFSRGRGAQESIPFNDRGGEEPAPEVEADAAPRPSRARKTAPAAKPAARKLPARGGKRGK